MDQLQEARARIDEIDARMAALFEERMHAVGQVAQYKARTGKAVFDAGREASLIARNTDRISDEALRPYYKEFLGGALSVSRAYQRALLGRDVAAYQGVEGAWSHIALRRLFPFARARSYATWAEVIEAVEQGDAFCGVLPIENSNAGDVSTVLDLLYAHRGLTVTQMCDLPIRQDLLGVPGAGLDQIRTVISHQQALAQSSPFLRARGYATRVWGNTADAARYVAEQGDPSLAAIASAETARLYGLQILVEGVNEDGDNTTRFVVIERSENAGQRTAAPGQRLAMLFTVDHKPGKLAQVIQIIGERGFNMETIKSRPLPHVQFEYYFYVQLICPDGAAPEDAGRLVRELEQVCRTVRILGVFDL
ncbi:MAG: prephenate dehydratase domain-containing protein [Gemmiger sp.]|uniref:bifunctional chorismate mutase/prephenate dehydratase n=1 Tax=Gemmiger sp. TaxID=2049027 RepID=UPI002E7890B2|nr:prephenate dehydratase domain-containing protein [Gemmiger sp.]MEE0800828.1 prephenate dehydratase domain-containing protein [Gemmiger sp.]